MKVERSPIEFKPFRIFIDVQTPDECAALMKLGGTSHHVMIAVADHHPLADTHFGNNERFAVETLLIGLARAAEGVKGKQG